MGTMIDLDPFGGEDASMANSKDKITSIRKECYLQNTYKTDTFISRLKFTFLAISPSLFNNRKKHVAPASFRFC